MRIQHLALLVSLLIASASGAQSPSSARAFDQLSATVIVPNDYPAFSPPPPGTTARPLRALVLLQAPNGADSTVILLNPAYANAHTLYEALSIVRRRAGVPQRERIFAIGMVPGVRVPMGAVASRLDSIVAALTSPDTPQAERYRIHGTTTEIADAREFFGSEPRP